MSTFDKIVAAANRYNELLEQHSVKPLGTKMDLVMDIDCASQDVPLNFDQLLASNDVDFARDIGGIIRHFDRESLTLVDFLPTCAVRH